MGQKFAVFIAYDDEPNTKRYSAEFQTQDEYVKGWQSALKKAHHTSGQKSVISCGCRGKGAKWICPYISRHLLSLNPLQARCRRYSRGER